MPVPKFGEVFPDYKGRKIRVPKQKPFKKSLMKKPTTTPKAPAAAKPETVKVPKAPKSTVKLVTFSVKATIPTGQFANIIPEIVVTAATLEEAKAYALPQMEALYDQYLNFLENRKEIKAGEVRTVEPAVKAPQTAETSQKTDDKGVFPAPKAPVQAGGTSEAFQKAKTAIDSAYMPDAIELLGKQIQKSERLTDDEKKQLAVLVEARSQEIEPTIR